MKAQPSCVATQDHYYGYDDLQQVTRHNRGESASTRVQPWSLSNHRLFHCSLLTDHSALHYVLKDYLDPSAIINPSGTVIERFGYDAFGPVRFMDAAFAPRTTTAAAWNFLFHAEFLDEDTGLYNYGYRYYNPQLGRWPSRDPIGEMGGLNLYSFVKSNPLRNLDILGRSDSPDDLINDFLEDINPPIWTPEQQQRDIQRIKNEIANREDAPWMKTVSNEIGIAEIKGEECCDRILDYINSIDSSDARNWMKNHGEKGDDNPWCACFANWVIKENGFEGMKGYDAIRAFGFKNCWCESLIPLYGALVIFPNRHVGFVVGEDGDYIVVIGGNQDDQVTPRKYKRRKVWFTDIRANKKEKIPCLLKAINPMIYQSAEAQDEFVVRFLIFKRNDNS